MDILNPANLILGAVGLGLLVLKVWALIDCAVRPTAAFPLNDKLTKPVWLAILALTVLTALVTQPIGLFGIVGTVAAIVYLVDVKPAVTGSGHSSW